MTDKEITKLTDKQAISLYINSKQKYHTNGTSPLTDIQYDQLEARVKKLRPDLIKQVGATPIRSKVKLPVPMGSLEKLKPGGSLEKWVIKHEISPKIIATHKLDGISLLLEYNKGRFVRAYTRR